MRADAMMHIVPHDNYFRGVCVALVGLTSLSEQHARNHCCLDIVVQNGHVIAGHAGQHEGQHDCDLCTGLL